MTAPRVELLFSAGCPSYPRALAELRAELAAAGLDPDAVELHEIVDEAQARAERFPGSPTVRVDGRDVAPTGDPPAFACRLYRRRDGRRAPTPDPADVRDALG